MQVVELLTALTGNKNVCTAAMSISIILIKYRNGCRVYIDNVDKNVETAAESILIILLKM